MEELISLAVTFFNTLSGASAFMTTLTGFMLFFFPRNYAPPKWDSQGGVCDRSRGVRRNWILVWEDRFCNFAASTAETITGGGESTGYDNSVCEYQQYNNQGLQPELFFKMSHEIYKYGEG